MNRNDYTKSATEIAGHLGVDAGTVRNWAANKKVPCLKVGSRYRFNLEQVVASFNTTKTINPMDEV